MHWVVRSLRRLFIRKRPAVTLVRCPLEGEYGEDLGFPTEFAERMAKIYGLSNKKKGKNTN